MSFRPSPLSPEELCEELRINLLCLCADVFSLECICDRRGKWDKSYPEPLVRYALTQAAGYIEDHALEIISASRFLTERVAPPQ